MAMITHAARREDPAWATISRTQTNYCVIYRTRDRAATGGNGSERWRLTKFDENSAFAGLLYGCPSDSETGTYVSMDVWLDGGDRSDLYSDEGTLFGHLGIAAWEEMAQTFYSWLVREN